MARCKTSVRQSLRPAAHGPVISCRFWDKNKSTLRSTPCFFCFFFSFEVLRNLFPREESIATNLCSSHRGCLRMLRIVDRSRNVASKSKKKVPDKMRRATLSNARPRARGFPSWCGCHRTPQAQEKPKLEKSRWRREA